MIRKYLVVGKQIFMTSKKLEDQSAKIPTVELLLPINLYWELEALMKRIDYLQSAGEDPVLINDHYQQLYRKVVKYVVSEKDRILVQQKIHGG